MAIFAIFLLGIGNFAMHKAILESGHRLLRHAPASMFVRMLGGRITLVFEFFVLLAAMLLTQTGWGWVLWVYCGYSALNALSAWLMLTDRV